MVNHWWVKEKKALRHFIKNEGRTIASIVHLFPRHTYSSIRQQAYRMGLTHNSLLDPKHPYQMWLKVLQIQANVAKKREEVYERYQERIKEAVREMQAQRKVHSDSRD